MKPPAPDGTDPAFCDELIAFLRAAGDRRYDEVVTQMEHALQSAALAESVGAAPALVAAALLHDIGHLIQLPLRDRERIPSRDLHHEAVGAEYLGRAFGAHVARAVRLHVPAKRYLCAVEPAYWDGLSDGSKHSLELQGGPMTAEERRNFEAQAGWRDAVRLRRWDDGAKVPGLAVPDLSAYRETLAACRRSAETADP